MSDPYTALQDLVSQTPDQANDPYSALQNLVTSPTDSFQSSNALPPINADQGQDPWSNFQNVAQNIVKDKGINPAILPVLLGQSAMESARGTATPGNNYFGIKGSGDAGSNNLATQEYGSGGYYGENAGFAAYNSPADSINAYLNLIESYPGVPEAIRSGDPSKIIQAIEASGYATSPTYVQDVMNTPEFQKFSGGLNGK